MVTSALFSTTLVTANLWYDARNSGPGPETVIGARANFLEEMDYQRIKTISILNATTKNNKFTVFTVEIQYEGFGPVLLERRYRQFHSLDKKLKQNFKHFQTVLPKKVLFGNLQPALVETRLQQLNVYLRDVVANPLTAGSSEFCCFRDASRTCFDKIKDIFDAIDDSDMALLSTMLSGSSPESFNLVKKGHRTTWAGCCGGAAVAALGVMAVAAPGATLAACAKGTFLAAQAAGTVGLVVGAGTGACLASKRPVTAAIGGGAVGAAAGFAGTYIGAIAAVPAAVGGAVGYFDLSPLHYAIVTNRVAPARALIESGANLGCTCSCAAGAGWLMPAGK